MIKISFKDIAIGSLFYLNGNIYKKINNRMAMVDMPSESYNGKKFYVGQNEICQYAKNVPHKVV